MQTVTPSRYARETIAKLLKQFITYEPGVRANKDMEPLHQMRVTSRRLRNAFWVFKGLFPAKVLKESQNNIRAFGRVLGRARDLDVKIEFLKELQSAVRNIARRSEVVKLTLILRKKRARFQPSVLAALDQLYKKGVLGKIEGMLTAASIEKGPEAQRLYCVAEKKILKRLNRFLQYEAYVYKPKRVKELHQMRIAAKHLRYTLESFAPLYGKATHKFIKQVMAIQGYLGEVHDFDAWKNSLNDFTAANFLKNTCEHYKEQGYKNFVRTWEKSKQQKIFEQLAGFIRRELH